MIKYKFIPICSYLPNFIIMFWWHRFPPHPETCEGFWFDVSYYKYCRKDKKNNIDNESLEETINGWYK